MKKEIILPKDVQLIIRTLQEHGFEAFAVGGCVRDVMLDREPGDWDITTSAKPMEIKSCFSKTIDTGIQHGTVTVMLHHVGYEITTYRIDGEYEDGRHPKQVEFTSDLKYDLERRDFTINAMAYNDQEGLIDEFGGILDLKRKRICCVGDPLQRFDEDALRMLRAVRFSGQLGFSIEAKTREAITKKAKTLSRVSAERIRVELSKLLVSKDAGRLMEAYETGMTAVFLPEFDKMVECNQMNPHHIYSVGRHSLHAVQVINYCFGLDTEKWNAPLIPKRVRGRLQEMCGAFNQKEHLILAVAMLLHDVAKPECMTIDEAGVGHFYGHPEKGEKIAVTILKRLTFDNETIDIVKRLIRFHDYRFEPGETAIRKSLSKMGPDIANYVFLVQYADILAQNPLTYEPKLKQLDTIWKVYQKILKKEDPLTLKDLAVNGMDLIERGMKPGPEIGHELQRLLGYVLETPQYNRKEVLLKLLSK